MAVAPDVAQKVLALAIGQDSRLKPATESDAALMVMAWADALPSWLSFDIARAALAARAQDPQASQYPITLTELNRYAKAAKRGVERRERNAAGVYTTLPVERRLEGDGPVPLPDNCRARLEFLGLYEPKSSNL